MSSKSFKRVKANWLIIVMLVGTYIPTLLACIFILESSKFVIEGLAAMGVIWVFAGLLSGRTKLTINDELLTIGSDLWTYVKIRIPKIKHVIVVEANLRRKKNAKFEKHKIDSVKQAVSIMMKNGKTYQLIIKDSEMIKDELEKRITPSN